MCPLVVGGDDGDILRTWHAHLHVALDCLVELTVSQVTAAAGAPFAVALGIRLPGQVALGNVDDVGKDLWQIVAGAFWLGENVQRVYTCSKLNMT